MPRPEPVYEGTANGYVAEKEEFSDMLSSYGECLSEFDGVRANYIGREFELFDTNISVRSEYNLADYNYFRHGEAIPHKQEKVIEMAMKAYRRVGIVRNVVDMMADFTVAGIRIVHPNKKIENFFKNWAKTVQFKIVSERIANMMYRTGNVPIKIKYGKVPVSVERDWRQSHAKDEIKLKKLKVDKRRIPLGYHVLNPLSIEVIGGELSAFVGKPVYALKVTTKTRLMMDRMERLAMKNKDITDQLEYLPMEMREAIKGGKAIIPIDQDKIRMVHYKKDDWDIWASPMIESILSNLALLEKMHLADKSALDGAISQIRLWKLGIYNESNPAHSVLPMKGSVAKLRAILSKVGNGVLDLVWGPELDFKESDSKVHNYLKAEKYEQVMREIYQGLGVPATLTGSTGASSGGFTNNAISMKTLVERLEYGREIIIAFWEEQFKIIQKAMGWRFAPKVMFDYRVLTDESSEKAVLVELYDRNIIATETMHELCKRDPELEALRISRERKKIEKGTMPDKAGPYHNAEKDHDLKKIILQAGGATPSEVGIELAERKEGEQTKNEQMMQMEKDRIDVQERMNKEKVTMQKNKPTSPGGDGRPKNSKDKSQRKQRTPKPRTNVSKAGFVDVFLWAQKAQKQITDMMTPFFLENYKKKNMRSLTKSEALEAENLKLDILCGFEPFSEITKESVYKVLESNKSEIKSGVSEFLKGLSMIFVERNDREPSLEEFRQMQASAYALEFEEEEF